MAEERQTTERVEKVGDLTVYVVGEDSRDKQDEKENIKKKEVMITFHDVGMNHKICFERFFQHEDIVGLVDRFVIYHVDAPGQESKAENLAPDSVGAFNYSTALKKPYREHICEQVQNGRRKQTEKGTEQTQWILNGNETDMEH